MKLEDVKKQFFENGVYVHIEDEDYEGAEVEFHPDLNIIQYGIVHYDEFGYVCYDANGLLAKATTIEEAWELSKKLFEEFLEDRCNEKVKFDFED